MMYLKKTPKCGKRYIHLQTQDSEQTPNKINSKKYSQTNVIVKLLNMEDKENILKAVREKQHLIYKGKII